MSQRTIVIGDVHGCLDELRELLDKLKHDQDSDRLVFLGDLLDRGPDPIGVLRLVRQFGAECCLGNHEEKHLRYSANTARAAAGGLANAMKPYSGERAAQHAALTVDDIAWIGALPAYIEIGERWLAVHAGFLPDPAIHLQDPKKVCRIRWVSKSTRKMIRTSPGDPEPPSPDAAYWTELWPGPRGVFYGHNVHGLGVPYVTDGSKHGSLVAQTSASPCFGMDTGCCFGGHLTAAVLEGDRIARFVSVPARRKYAELIGAGGVE